MLLRFWIEPELLREIPNERAWVLFLRDLSEFWPVHGVLMWAPDFEERLKAIAVDPTRLSEWRKFWAHDGYRKVTFNDNSVDTCYRTAQSWEDLRACSIGTDLLVLQDRRAALFDLVEERTYCAHDPASRTELEICRAHHLLLTCRVRQLSYLSNHSIPSNEAPLDVWNSRLREHAAYSRLVRVVDKFAVRGNSEGLKFLIERMITDAWAASKEPCQMDIYSTYGRFEGDVDNCAPAIKNSLEGYGENLSKANTHLWSGLRINVHLFEADEMQHDRWISFDKNVMELSGGLAILEKNRKDDLDFHLKTSDEQRRREMERLSGLSRKRKPDDLGLIRVFSKPPKRRW